MVIFVCFRNHLSNHHQKHEYKCTEEKKFTSVTGKINLQIILYKISFSIKKILLIGNLPLKQVLARNT
jgi:hypothetical protein